MSKHFKQKHVFLSYASEDAAYVDALETLMTRRGIEVWRDKHNLGCGDEISKAIKEGMQKSKVAIVVLSPNYVARGKFWTMNELFTLLRLENTHGIIVLPIWLNLETEDLISYAAIFSTRKAMNADEMTPEDIVDQVTKALLHYKKPKKAIR